MKFKTLVKTFLASKVITLKKTLEYVNAINIYYTWQNSSLQTKVFSGLTWAIARAITKTLNLIGHQCLLN